MARPFDRLTARGVLEEGKLKLNNERWFRGMLSQYDDCNVQVTVSRQRKRRSKEQMGYLWGVVYPEISRYTGHTPEDLHRIFKSRFLRDKIVWRGAEITTLRSTSTMTTNELADFITQVIVEAASMGIVVPEPDKLYQFKETE